MNKIVLRVRYCVKQRLCRMLRKCRNAGTRLRYLMVLNVINGRSTRQTAKVLHVHPTTVVRVVQRFRRYGEAGLQDGRSDNGEDKLSEGYLQRLHTIVSQPPDVYGWRRPTWTRELSLVAVNEVRFLSIQINEPVNQNTFDASLPGNARVVDYIEGTAFKTDNLGQIAGEVRPAPSNPFKSEVFAEPITLSNGSMGWVVVIVTSLLVLAGSGLWIWWKKHRFG